MIESARIRWPRSGELTPPASVVAQVDHTPAETLGASIAAEWWQSLIYVPGHGWAVLEGVTWAFRSAEDVAIAIALQEHEGGDAALAARLAIMPVHAPRAERRAVRKALDAWARKSVALPLVRAALHLAAPLMTWAVDDANRQRATEAHA